MLGIILTLFALLAIGFGSYRLGSSMSIEDLGDRDASRNTSYVVLALGAMMAACGMLALASNGLPFDFLARKQDPLSELL